MVLLGDDRYDLRDCSPSAFVEVQPDMSLGRPAVQFSGVVREVLRDSIAVGCVFRAQGCQRAMERLVN